MLKKMILSSVVVVLLVGSSLLFAGAKNGDKLTSGAFRRGKGFEKDVGWTEGGKARGRMMGGRRGQRFMPMVCDRWFTAVVKAYREDDRDKMGELLRKIQQIRKEAKGAVRKYRRRAGPDKEGDLDAWSASEDEGANADGGRAGKMTGRRQGQGPHHRGRDCLKKLDLTEEQQAAIDAIRKRAGQAAQGAQTPEEKQQIRRRADEAIKAGLTEEQLEELEKCRQRPRPRRMRRQRRKSELTEGQFEELEKCRERPRPRRMRRQRRKAEP